MRALLLVSTALLAPLAGCTSLSGFDAGNSFACKAPPGVSCQSISGTYANAVAGALPSQRQNRGQADSTETVFGKGTAVPAAAAAPSGAPPAPAPVAGRDVPPMELPRATGLPTVSPAHMNAPHSGSPLRTPERVVRIWIAPYEDTEGDLYEQRYVYTTVARGRWLIEHNQAAIRNRFQQIRPLSRPQQSDSNQTTPQEAATSLVRPTGTPRNPAPAGQSQ